MPDSSKFLVGILIALVGWLLLLYVHRKNARRAAAAKFRATLLEAFSGLYPVASNWPNNVDAHLRHVFPTLQRAVAEFRPYVSWRAHRAYENAWFVYRLGEDGREIDKQVYHQYMGFTSPGELVIDPQETFRANVSKLLGFASET